MRRFERNGGCGRFPAGQVSVTQALVLFWRCRLWLDWRCSCNSTVFAIATGHCLACHRRSLIPFMKRITWWPQVVLGLAFSWGALMGFAVTFGRIDFDRASVLYAGSIAWVIGYEHDSMHIRTTEDDALIGIKSTARLFWRAAHAFRHSRYFTAVAVLLIGVALGTCRRRLPGMDRAWWPSPAHLVWPDQAPSDRRSRAVPAGCSSPKPRCWDSCCLPGLLVDAVMRAA